MFGDLPSLSTLSLSGVSAPQGLPVFNIGGGVDFNQSVAQQSYLACMAQGGNADTCGANAVKAGLPSNTITNDVNQNSGASIWDSTKCWLNAWSIDDIKKCASGKANDAQAVNNSSSIFSDLSRLSSLIIGIIFVAAALFLLKSPISIVSEAIKGN